MPEAPPLHTREVAGSKPAAPIVGCRAILRGRQFRDFGLSVGLPSDAEEPAAVVTLTAAEEEGHAAATEEPEAEDTTAPDEDVATEDDDDDSNGLAMAALVVGGLGLVAGGTSLARTRT